MPAVRENAVGRALAFCWGVEIAREVLLRTSYGTTAITLGAGRSFALL